jgi:hypothetical protein
MSIVMTETSPRALLDSALELSYNLNLMADGDAGDGMGPTRQSIKGPGFVLKEVEKTLLQVCKDLDVGKDADPKVPLMMRLRTHIDCISTVLTGNSVEFSLSDTTTLHELIESLSMLNKSVCLTESRTVFPSSCVIN